MTFHQWAKLWSEWSTEHNSILADNPAKRFEANGEAIHPADTATNCHPDDPSLLDYFLSHPNFSPGWSSIPKSEQAEIALLDKLNKIKGCPLYIYDDVIAWTKEHLQCESTMDADDNIIPLLRSRRMCMKHFETSAHAEINRPITKDIDLQACHGKVLLTKVPFLGSLYNLLTDVELIQDSTLLNKE